MCPSLSGVPHVLCVFVCVCVCVCVVTALVCVAMCRNEDDWVMESAGKFVLLFFSFFSIGRDRQYCTTTVRHPSCHTILISVLQASAAAADCIVLRLK